MQIKLPHVRHSLIALFATLFLVGVAYSGGTVIALLQNGIRPPRLMAAAEFPFNPTLSPEVLTAKSAILFDPTSGRVLFAKDAGTQRPLASITKLMTAEIVLTEEKPDTPVTITAEDLAPEGDWGFKVGDTLPLHDLLRIGLIASSNDAMQAAAASLGEHYITKMNQVAQTLGLTQTYFLNPTGLDINGDTSGAYGSAYDVARLAALFYKQYPSYFELTQNSSVSIDDNGRTLNAHATALPLLSIPGFVGAKTGYTDLAGGNLVAVFDIEIGHPIVAVVLGSTEAGRFEDIRTLIDAARHPNP